ncbi:MAG: hypothetical protein AAGF01_16895 [Cyanobacteria bacterium P01_G01_bin.38]
MRSANGLFGVYENAATAILLRRDFANAPALARWLLPKRNQLSGFNLKICDLKLFL